MEMENNTLEEQELNIEKARGNQMILHAMGKISTEELEKNLKTLNEMQEEINKIKGQEWYKEGMSKDTIEWWNKRGKGIEEAKRKREDEAGFNVSVSDARTYLERLKNDRGKPVYDPEHIKKLGPLELLGLSEAMKNKDFEQIAATENYISKNDKIMDEKESEKEKTPSDSIGTGEESGATGTPEEEMEDEKDKTPTGPEDTGTPIDPEESEKERDGKSGGDGTSSGAEVTPEEPEKNNEEKAEAKSIKKKEKNSELGAKGLSKIWSKYGQFFLAAGTIVFAAFAGGIVLSAFGNQSLALAATAIAGYAANKAGILKK